MLGILLYDGCVAREYEMCDVVFIAFLSTPRLPLLELLKNIGGKVRCASWMITQR